ncbi:MAG: zinc-binding dehydrogenase [Anaerolineales bacterium]|jgi:NADPH:quinone reductase-like Zn-dependent oxidoreductase
MLFHEHGGPDVLKYEQVPTPSPGPGEVLVELHAAALNRVDLWVRNGWPGLKLEMPHISGSDGAGTIAALGSGVEGLQEGDRVVINANLGCGKCDQCLAGYDNRCRDWHLLGETVRGTLAEFIVVPARNVLPLPEDMHFSPAAAASLVYLTAWHSLITRGALRPGERVLIVGASGGVNTACIQIAKFTGAEVYVVGSNEQKLALAESLGADRLIDRSKEENWSKAVYLATNREGVDVVVDNVGASSMMMSMRSAKKGGRILTVGNTGGAKFEIDNRFIFGKHLSIIGSTMGTLSDYATVMGLVFEGKLQPVIDQGYPIQETPDAERRLEAGEQMGKIIIEIKS